jgi:hypothetical protein
MTRKTNKMDLMKENSNGKPISFNHGDDLDSVLIFNDLFYRNLKDSKVQLGVPTDTVDKKIYKDLVIEYSYNNLGYRGRSDIDGSEELLVLGCSQTYGTGLPLHLTWGDIFAQNINKKYALLAQEGDSLQAQVYKAFKYFEEFGHPKVIVGVFPSIRIEFPHIPNKSGTNMGRNKKETDSYPRIMQSFGHRGNPIRLSASPHDIDEILPREFYIFYDFIFIQMLEQYCKVNDIMLIWNCYQDVKFIDHLKGNQPVTLKNYLEINYSDVLPKFESMWDEIPLNINEYGSEFSMLPDYNESGQYKSLYYHAADFEIDKNSGHWGAYAQKYIAEIFYLEYRNRISQIE